MGGSAWTNQVQFLVIVAGGGIAGVYVYDPTAKAGNLIASMTDATADPFGDVTEKGVSAYVIDADSLRMAVNLNINSINGSAGMSIRDTAHPPADPPGFYGQGSGTGGLSRAVAFVDSGLVTNADVDAVVSVQSQTHSAVTSGLVSILAGRIDIGNNVALQVNDNTGQVAATNSTISAPSLITSDTWHSLSIGGSWAASGSGQNGFFYTLLNNGNAMIVWDVSTSSANPGTLGTLPAAYRPNKPVRLQSGWSGTGPAAYNDQFNPTIQVAVNGNVTGAGLFVSGLNLFGTAEYPLSGT